MDAYAWVALHSSTYTCRIQPRAISPAGGNRCDKDHDSIELSYVLAVLAVLKHDPALDSTRVFTAGTLARGTWSDLDRGGVMVGVALGDRKEEYHLNPNAHRIRAFPSTSSTSVLDTLFGVGGRAGCSAGAAMAFWQASCLHERLGSVITAFHTHSTGLKLKGDRLKCVADTVCRPPFYG